MREIIGNIILGGLGLLALLVISDKLWELYFTCRYKSKEVENDITEYLKGLNVKSDVIPDITSILMSKFSRLRADKIYMRFARVDKNTKIFKKLGGNPKGAVAILRIYVFNSLVYKMNLKYDNFGVVNILETYCSNLRKVGGYITEKELNIKKKRIRTIITTVVLIVIAVCIYYTMHK